MNWLFQYRVRLYVRNSLWILPAMSIVVALVGARALITLELAMGWRAAVSPDTGRLIMSTVAGSTFTLVVLVSSAMLLAVQLASAQLTPRIIALIYRSPYGKLAFAVFVFTFTFAVATLLRIEQTVPLIASYIAGYGFLISLALFILFTDTMGKMLRPSSALRRVGLEGREVINDVYPSLLTTESKTPESLRTLRTTRPRIIPSTQDGAVLAFDMPGLIRRAEQFNCVIELVPQVGDFIAEGDPVFRVYGGGERLADRDLRNSIAIGHERTLEQDPMFAFRILVDIASKALSPAINDPTTAVLAIDQIHHLLRGVGKRHLADGHEEDAAGHLRLVYRTPDWEDFVQLGMTEIRQYGRDSIQVQRRLQAMVEDLLETLPAERHPILLRKLALLDTSRKRAFPDVDDQVLAEAGDLQGIGGSDDELYEGDQTALTRRAI
ncbi:MAG TPA: DUF2254 domain-containing protein [Pyrinomonadaceae bacterium]|nr:DUF2254 domain-containing protein [Pyrinomonadaceae bacterium]